MNFKKSQYNLSIEIGQQFYLFNTFNQNLAAIDLETLDIIDSGNFNDLNNEDKDELFSGGFIVSSNRDEYNEYLKLFENKKDEKVLTIKLLLATTCNSKCIYCYQNLANYNHEIINDERIQIFTKWLTLEIEKNKIEEVNIELFGGEPLLAAEVIPDFYKLLKTISTSNDVKFSSALITNGTLLTDELIEVFIDNNVELKITIDGLEEVHNNRRKLINSNSNAYETVISNLKKISNLGRADLINIRMNLDSQNLNDVDALACELFNLGIEKFYCGRVLFRGKKTDYDKFLISSKEFDKNIDVKLYNILKKYGYANIPSMLELKLSCQFHNKYGYVISPSLKVAKCDELLDIPEYQIGYIDVKSELIFTNDNYLKQSTSSPADFEQCRNCKFLPLCGTGCPIVSLNTFGNLYEKNCSINEETIKMKLTNILQSI